MGAEIWTKSCGKWTFLNRNSWDSDFFHPFKSSHNVCSVHVHLKSPRLPMFSEAGAYIFMVSSTTRFPPLRFPARPGKNARWKSPGNPAFPATFWRGRCRKDSRSGYNPHFPGKTDMNASIIQCAPWGSPARRPLRRSFYWQCVHIFLTRSIVLPGKQKLPLATLFSVCYTETIQM